jgi:hypothetical protein
MSSLLGDAYTKIEGRLRECLYGQAHTDISQLFLSSQYCLVFDSLCLESQVRGGDTACCMRVVGLASECRTQPQTLAARAYASESSP